MFAEFWAAYPRKVGRLAAIKAFTKIAPSRALVDTMIAAVEAQGRTREWRDGFIPHASTWLNGARWEDEIDAPARAVEPSTWRDRCPHDPTCGTPTRCMSLQAREEVTT